jgi:hypothetical protein
MSVQSWLAVVLVAVAAAGCARNRDESSETNAPVSVLRPGAQTPDGGTILTPVEGVTGKVSAANANLKFVVITFPIGKMAADGQRLSVYRDGLKVGEVLVTGPRSDDSTVADVISGDARIGDDIRER